MDHQHTVVYAQHPNFPGRATDQDKKGVRCIQVVIANKVYTVKARGSAKRTFTASHCSQSHA